MDKKKETMVRKIEYLKETICHCENNLQYIKRLQALKYWLLKLDVLLDNSNDENFGSLGNDISMWKLYNLLTGSNKSSYIDSFLDRAVNATEIATGINAALHGDTKYKWFID